LVDLLQLKLLSMMQSAFSNKIEVKAKAEANSIQKYGACAVTRITTTMLTIHERLGPE